MAKYLTLDGLQTFYNGLKTKLSGKVDVVEGKGLSTNDLTDELKAVYDAHETNVIVGVSVNGSNLTADGSRIVDVTVPTATSALTNDSDFATNSGVAGSYYNKTEMDGTVQGLEQSIADTASAASAAVAATDKNLADNYYNKTAVDGTVQGLEQSIEAANKNVADNYYDKTAMDGKVETINGAIADANAAVEAANKNVTDNYYNKTAIDETVERLEQAINAGSTDVADNYYDKTAIDGKVSAIEEAVAAAAAGKVTVSIVDAIPTVEAAEANIIYFVPRTNDETNNIYDQYMLIDGVIEAVGSTEVNLAEYVKSADLNAISDDEIDGVLAS